MKITSAIQAFVEQLGLSISEVEIEYNCSFYGQCALVSTPDGKEYHVYASEDDAREGALEWNRSLIEDENSLPNLCIDNFIDKGFMSQLASEEAEFHSSEDYTYDRNNDGQTKVEFERELRSALVDKLADFEVYTDLDDEIDALISKAVDSMDFDRNEDGETQVECYERIQNEIEADPIEYLHNIYSESDMAKFLMQNNALDIDAMCEECVDIDGIAHCLAGYDGQQIDIEGGAVAYRWN